MGCSIIMEYTYIQIEEGKGHMDIQEALINLQKALELTAEDNLQNDDILPTINV